MKHYFILPTCLLLSILFGCGGGSGDADTDGGNRSAEAPKSSKSAAGTKPDYDVLNASDTANGIGSDVHKFFRAIWSEDEPRTRKAADSFADKGNLRAVLAAFCAGAAEQAAKDKQANAKDSANAIAVSIAQALTYRPEDANAVALLLHSQTGDAWVATRKKGSEAFTVSKGDVKKAVDIYIELLTSAPNLQKDLKEPFPKQ